MSELFSTDPASYLLHILINIFISDQLTMFLQIGSIDIENSIFIYNFSVLINSKATICVSIICKPYIQFCLFHKSLQTFYMRGTRIIIYVYVIRFCIDEICFCTKCIKNRFRRYSCSLASKSMIKAVSCSSLSFRNS